MEDEAKKTFGHWKEETVDLTPEEEKHMTTGLLKILFKMIEKNRTVAGIDVIRDDQLVKVRAELKIIEVNM